MRKMFCLSGLGLITGMMLLYSCINSKKKIKNPKMEVVIDNHVWYLKLVDVVSFSNGELIPEVKTNEEWVEAGKKHRPAWCNFNNDPGNNKLYNWYAVNNPAGLAPEGWHIPTDEEWNILIKQWGGEMEAAGNMKLMNDDVAAYTGIRDSTGEFSVRTGAWWSTTDLDIHDALMRFGYQGKDFLLRSKTCKTEGLSVLCIKN